MKTVKGIVVAAAAVAAAVCASSCSTSRILVGDVKPKEPMIEVSKEHNAHFLGGLVKTGKTIAQEHVGDAENYAVLTRYGFGDIMLSFVTGYIYTPTTTKYYIPVRYMDDFEFAGGRQRRERVHKDRGFVIGVEIGGGAWPGPHQTDAGRWMTAWTADAALTFGYQANPHFYVAAGFDLSQYKEFGDDAVVLGSAGGGLHALLQPFVRFRYTVLDRNSSPFVSLDLGFPLLSNEDYSDAAWAVTPTVGYRFRVGRARNAGFDIGIGYRLGEFFSEIDSPFVLKGCSLNALLLKIGFSITL